MSAPLFVLQLNPFKLLVGGAESLALSDVCSFWVHIVMFLRDETLFYVLKRSSLYMFVYDESLFNVICIHDGMCFVL